MLDFLYIAVSWVLLRWHDLFVVIGFSEKSGTGWTLSVVFLVITARLLLFRLFVKQVHYQRNMQRLQPKLQKIKEKYKNDRAEQQRQMMALQQEEGFNPLAGCLPMLLQIPVFLGLYHVLRHLANSASPINKAGQTLCDDRQQNSLLTLYTFSKNETCNAATAKLFGAPLASSFRDNDALFKALGGMSPDLARFGVILPLLLISAGATLATQLLVRANQTVVPEGTAATIQRVMLWLIPVGVMASGLIFSFPLGVLLYWFTSNLWTLAQQAYIIRFHPQEEPVKAEAGTVGKSLAPKPGQRPVRMAKDRPGATSDDANSLPDESSGSTRDAAPRNTTPRPGQRPNRGKRPPAKRPTQAKKRR